MSTGQEVLSYCTSCKMDLNHIVVAMKGDRVAKCECQTCKKTHGFRAPKGITEPPKKKVRKSASAAEAPRSVEAEWTKLMEAKRAVDARKYNMKANFGMGDKINHPNFGEGVVSKLIYPNKLEVVFKADIKILIHGGPPPVAAV